MKKKILSLVLALAMVMSLFPGMSMTASAASAAPTITSQPKDVSISASALQYNLALTVIAEGEDLTYQWEYRASSDGEFSPIADATLSTYKVLKSVSLIIGEYRCVVTNELGSVNSDVAKVVRVGFSAGMSSYQTLPFPEGDVDYTAAIESVSDCDDGDARTIEKIDYAWYQCTDNKDKISGLLSTESSYTVPRDLTEGSYRYYCEVTVTWSDSTVEKMLTFVLPVDVEKMTPITSVEGLDVNWRAVTAFVPMEPIPKENFIVPDALKTTVYGDAAWCIKATDEMKEALVQVFVGAGEGTEEEVTALLNNMVDSYKGYLPCFYLNYVSFELTASDTYALLFVLEAQEGYFFKDMDCAVQYEPRRNEGYFLVPYGTKAEIEAKIKNAGAGGDNDAADIVINVDTTALPKLYPYTPESFMEAILSAFSIDETTGYALVTNGGSKPTITTAGDKTSSVGAFLLEGEEYGVVLIVQDTQDNEFTGSETLSEGFQHVNTVSVNGTAYLRVWYPLGKCEMEVVNKIAVVADESKLPTLEVGKPISSDPTELSAALSAKEGEPYTLSFVGVYEGNNEYTSGTPVAADKEYTVQFKATFPGYDGFRYKFAAENELSFEPADKLSGAYCYTSSVYVNYKLEISEPPVGRADVYIDSRTNDAFLGGEYIELGLRPNGAFGTTAGAPTSGVMVFHPSTPGWDTGDSIGLRTNGDLKWSEGSATGNNATVDFFLPGVIDEGWLVGWSDEADGSAVAKGGAQAYDARYPYRDTATPGAEVDAKVKTADGKTIISAKTTATVGGAIPQLVDGEEPAAATVGVEQTVEFDITEKFFTTTVTLTNNGSNPIYDLSYIRAFDPDQRGCGLTSTSTDNYFYKDGKGNIWVFAFGNDSLGITDGYNPVAVDYNTMVKNNSAAITPFVFCATPSKDGSYTVQAVNAPYGWVMSSYSSFYRDNSSYLAGDDLYGKHYYADAGIGLEFIIDSLDAGETVTFSWISSLDTDVAATVGNISQAIGGAPSGGTTPPIILPPVGGSNNPEDVTTGSNTETTVPTTETTAKPSISGAGSNPTATVTDKMGTTIVDQAKENNSDTVVIAPEFNGSDDSASVVIPTKTVNELGRETNADLVVETPVATVTFGNNDLTTLGQPGGDVVITTEKVPGGVALDVTVNGQSMPSIPGGVLVNIPEENLTPGTVAMIVHEDGTRELVRKSVADVPDQTMFVPLDGSATVIIVDNAQKFDDVQERNWFSDAVAFASGHELFQGITATEFGPNVSTTRGMLATVIYRMENEPNFTGNDIFGDMSGKYYEEAAAWAASKGIVNGYAPDEFGGDDAITREQLAAMLWRYVGTPMSYHSVSHFNDADAISSYAEVAVAWANEMGIMNGRNGAVLDPKGEATRAEVAQMLMNFMALIAG